MAEFTAKDVQTLRQSTGAGMMDAKRALQENDGDFEAAVKWLREKGLGKAAERTGRENAQGAVAITQAGTVAAIVELKCETDFVAKSEGFVAVVQDLADSVAKSGEAAVDDHKAAVDDLKVTLKENIEVGRVVRFEAGEGNILDTYLHRQDGRGVRPSRRSPGPRASRRPRSRRSSRVATAAGSRSGCCSSRASPVTTRPPSPSSWKAAARRWCVSLRWSSAFSR